MTEGVTVNIIGLKDFTEAINALDYRAKNLIVRSATRLAANAIKDGAKLLAPVLQQSKTGNKLAVSGALRKAIYAGRSRSKSGPGVETFSVSVKSGTTTHGGKTKKQYVGAFYWRFVEAGHVVRGAGQKIKGGTRRRAISRNFILSYGGGRKQPGVFYLAGALALKKTEAIKVFEDQIEKRIAEESGKLQNTAPL